MTIELILEIFSPGADDYVVVVTAQSLAVVLVGIQELPCDHAVHTAHLCCFVAAKMPTPPVATIRERSKTHANILHKDTSQHKDTHTLRQSSPTAPWEGWRHGVALWAVLSRAGSAPCAHAQLGGGRRWQPQSKTRAAALGVKTPPETKTDIGWRICVGYTSTTMRSWSTHRFVPDVFTDSYLIYSQIRTWSIHRFVRVFPDLFTDSYVYSLIYSQIRTPDVLRIRIFEYIKYTNLSIDQKTILNLWKDQITYESATRSGVFTDPYMVYSQIRI